MTRPKIKITHDRASCCYDVTAPDGWCLEPGLHEVVCDYAADWPGDCAEARKMAKASAEWYQSRMEPCTDPGCEWCNE